MAMSLKQRITLAIKEKQKKKFGSLQSSSGTKQSLTAPNTPSPPKEGQKFGSLQSSSGTKQPLTSPSTTDSPKLDKQLFGPEKKLSPKFSKLKKKLSKS